MTDSPDYRMYLNERFAGLEALTNTKYDAIHEKLVAIETQTCKTNGRTTALEARVDSMEDCLQSGKAVKDALVIKHNLSWSRGISILTVGIMLFMAWLGYRNLTKQNEALNSRVDDLGSPVVTNPRGEFVPLPEGFTLKMWPNDFDEQTKDTVK